MLRYLLSSRLRDSEKAKSAVYTAKIDKIGLMLFQLPIQVHMRASVTNLFVRRFSWKMLLHSFLRCHSLYISPKGLHKRSHLVARDLRDLHDIQIKRHAFKYVHFLYLVPDSLRGWNMRLSLCACMHTAFKGMSLATPFSATQFIRVRYHSCLSRCTMSYKG